MMKKYLAIVVFLLLPFAARGQSMQSITNDVHHGAAAATPGFVNETSKNSTESTIALGTNPAGQTACANFSYCLPYTDPVLSGNLGIISGHFANSTTLTPTNTDDKSDSYTCTTGGSKDSGTNEWPFLCYGANLTAAAHKVTTTFGSTAVTQVTEKAAQFNNIATSSPLDGSIGSCAGASGTTANCASVTPTQANDLIYVLVCRAGTPIATSFAAGSGFTLITTDINDGCASEWAVDTGTGSLTPTMTLTPASTYIEIVAAFKSASAGTVPTGWYAERMMSMPTNAGSGNFAVQFPSAGNFLFNSNACGSTMDPTSITDGTNTWTSTGPIGGTSGVDEFYVPGAAANATGLLTINTSGSGDCTFTLYSFAGAPASPIVGRATYSSTSAATSMVFQNNPNTLTWLPTPTSGLALAVGSEGVNTSISVTAPSSGIFDAASFGGMPVDGPEPLDQNNPFARDYPAAGGSSLFTFGLTHSGATGFFGDVVGVWGAAGTGILNAAQNAASGAATTLAITVPSTTAGNLLTVAIGQASGTVTKVCTDGATCGAGQSFTQCVSCVSTGSGHGATTVWYLLSALAGKTTVTITFSGSVSNREAMYNEVQKGTGTWATDTNGGQVTNGTGGTSPNTLTGAAVTTTGSVGFCTALVSVGNAVTVAPASGNEFLYGSVIFSTTTDATAALLTTSAAAHTPTWTDSVGGDGFSESTMCFK